MKRLIHAGLAAIAASSAAAHAQTSPPPAPPSPPPAASDTSQDSQNDEIVVLAHPGDQVRIDRRTYTLREDASAQSMNMFDVLGRIPSVSVAPSGEITLLGASNVTIQINGQPVPGANLEQVLRGLPGNQVERIEVITNPSAQYSADTSGGIINIITRNRFQRGFNGTVQTSIDSLGGYHAGVAPSWSSGPWSLSGQVGMYGGENENNLRRERQDFPLGALATEDGARTFDYNGWYASEMQVAYAPTPRRRMSLALDGGEFNFNQGQHSVLANALGPTATRSSDTEASFRDSEATFNFQQDGQRPRETMKFNATLSSFDNAFDTVYASTPTIGAASHYATSYDQSTDQLNVKLDFEHPFEGENFLTFGAAYDQSDLDIASSLAVLAGAGPTPYDSDLKGVTENLAAYATYQFATGDWTWLPGVRVEVYRREVASGGLESDTENTRVFPTIHIRRTLNNHVDLDLSYTSRIQRPGIQQLDPSLRFSDVNRASGGNPDLQPTTVDAYEANFVYQHNRANFSVTAFDRISNDVVSQFTDVVGGVIITRPVNAGDSEQRGLQVLLRGPIGDHWRYSLSGNVLSRAFDALDSSGALSRRDEVEYDGIAQIDWRDVDQNAVGADQFQLELRFQGPRHGLQTETDAYVMANITWRRRVTSKLQAVFMVQDIFDSTDQITRTTTDDYVERTEFESPGTRFRLALTYQFGAGPQRPMGDDQQPGPPTPF